MEDATLLIQQAFDRAKVSGKPDWHRMTTAVLKNRLLDLTGNTFNEAEYGADTFTAFVLVHDDIVDVDKSKSPPIVTLRQAGSDSLEPGYVHKPSSRPRVRSDLWQAVLDYSSGREYVWDQLEKQARPSLDGDGRSTVAVPGVTQVAHQQWREEFADTTRTSLTSEQESQLDIWVQDQLPTSHLPRHLIPRWNGFLRDKVHEYLRNWFDESGLEPPRDLIVSAAGRTAGRGPDTEALRQLVLRVVGEMTEHELAQLNLPSQAVLRATRSRPS